MVDQPREIPVVPGPTEDRLNKLQLDIYREYREEFLTWLQEEAPIRGRDELGYAFSTVRRTAYDTDRFHRWAWDIEGGFTKQLTTEHGDDFLRHVQTLDLSATAKAARLKSLKRYFRWREIDWEPAVTFSGDNGTGSPRDYFTREERSALRESVLSLGTVPDYDSLDPQERNEWKRILASRLRMPAEEIGPAEFEKANGYKIPSIVYASLDAGFRPIEVARARTTWCDLMNERFLIPAEQSSKGRNNWSVAITSETKRMLERWLEERDRYDEYENTDQLWLTREGNPFSSRTLNYWLDKLLDEAGINTETRDLSWYSMRHSTATYIADERGLKAAKDQLRHERIETTARYDQTPDENRRNALENIEQ